MVSTLLGELSIGGSVIIPRSRRFRKVSRPGGPAGGDRSANSDTGYSDKPTILRISVITARAGATGPNGPAFANVGNLVEFTSVGTFQNALAVGFAAVHTELVAASLNATLTWNSDVLQPCAAQHLVFGGVTSFNPL